MEPSEGEATLRPNLAMSVWEPTLMLGKATPRPQSYLEEANLRSRRLPCRS